MTKAAARLPRFGRNKHNAQLPKGGWALLSGAKTALCLEDDCLVAVDKDLIVKDLV